MVICVEYIEVEVFGILCNNCCGFLGGIILGVNDRYIRIYV